MLIHRNVFFSTTYILTKVWSQCIYREIQTNVVYPILLNIVWHRHSPNKVCKQLWESCLELCSRGPILILGDGFNPLLSNMNENRPSIPAICPLLIFTKPLEKLSNTHTHVFVSLTLHDEAAFVPIGFHEKIRISRHVEMGQNIFDKE
jgi:hypothetical protein